MPATGTSNQRISSVLDQLAKDSVSGKLPPQWNDGNTTLELREFSSLNAGTVFRGVLATLRNDAPHIRESTGSERPIALQANEHLIEKNHFLYFTAQELLVWQVNGQGSHVVRFERYLTHCAGFAVVFADIIAATALARLQKGVVKRVEMRLARPKNALAVAPNDWGGDAMRLLSSSGGGSISIAVSTRIKGQGLLPAIKEALHRLLDQDETKSLKVRLVGETDLIDLFAERLKEKIEVLMNGLYPAPASIFAELQIARDRQQEALDEFFGIGEHVLD